MIKDSRLSKGKLIFGPSGAPVLTASCQATNVRLVPSSDETSEAVTVLCGDSLTATATTSWTLNITAIQDFDDPAGVVNYAFDHDGETVDFAWHPGPDGGVGWSGQVSLRAVEIGGDVNTRLTTEAEWPVVGKPVRTDKKPPSQESDAVSVPAEPAASDAASGTGSGKGK